MAFASRRPVRRSRIVDHHYDDHAVAVHDVHERLPSRYLGCARDEVADCSTAPCDVVYEDRCHDDVLHRVASRPAVHEGTTEIIVRDDHAAARRAAASRIEQRKLRSEIASLKREVSDLRHCSSTRAAHHASHSRSHRRSISPYEYHTHKSASRHTRSHRHRSASPSYVRTVDLRRPGLEGIYRLDPIHHDVAPSRHYHLIEGPAHGHAHAHAPMHTHAHAPTHMHSVPIVHGAASHGHGHFHAVPEPTHAHVDAAHMHVVPGPPPASMHMHSAPHAVDIHAPVMDAHAHMHPAPAMDAHMHHAPMVSHGPPMGMHAHMSAQSMHHVAPSAPAYDCVDASAGPTYLH
eukprot:TRINITY_DN34410_c0_g1_i1.p1 TRINITY_DN34410_c0_g1~~TRINITY_DN34410_c0_g1_i1.p1  ORF type:complete len:347 (+),score=25.76 TRINITY_DN34410_c0_g1_i1:132-1172(+)